MTRGIENTLIAHGGTEDIDIPASALNKLINDALKPDCDDRYEALQRQVEALEEANNRLADERDFYVNQCHAYEARLAGREFE
jgi:predicted S18 family serine protease